MNRELRKTKYGYKYKYFPDPLEAEQEKAVKCFRLANKKYRRTRPTAIVSSGGQKTVYECVCGSRHSVATSYRFAKHLAIWQEEHASCCGELSLLPWE